MKRTFRSSREKRVVKNHEKNVICFKESRVKERNIAKYREKTKQKRIFHQRAAEGNYCREIFFLAPYLFVVRYQKLLCEFQTFFRFGITLGVKVKFSNSLRGLLL